MTEDGKIYQISNQDKITPETYGQAVTIIGKTGTANPPQSFRSNGWFVGLAAPFESAREPKSSEIELAVLVLLPRAHGSQAAELARPLFAAYANERQQRDKADSTATSTGVTTNAATPTAVHVAWLAARSRSRRAMTT